MKYSSGMRIVEKISKEIEKLIENNNNGELVCKLVDITTDISLKYGSFEKWIDHQISLAQLDLMNINGIVRKRGEKRLKFLYYVTELVIDVNI